MMFRFSLVALALAGLALPAAAQRIASSSRIVVLEPDSAQLRQNETMLFVDKELAPGDAADDELFAEVAPRRGWDAPVDFFRAMSPVYTQLRRGLQRYRMSWGSLPLIEVPAGPALRSGATGERVAILRERLGLLPGDLYDEEAAEAVREFQRVHGLGADGIAGAATIEALNRGPEHYEQVAQINMDRARSLPERGALGRYILVDAAAARLWLYEDDRPVDEMRVVVGSPEQPTPMMAAFIRYAEANPYWNLPPDFTQNRIAPRVMADGTTYLRDRRYEVLADWTEEAPVLAPETVDWAAVAAGQSQLRVRQLPGPANSMGRIKFMMPNHLGIYLHDTPNRVPFQEQTWWISNGCVRLEDAERVARWLFGDMPTAQDPDRPRQVDLDDPVAVYITYLTATPDPDAGLVFRADPYGRDRPALARMARLDPRTR